MVGVAILAAMVALPAISGNLYKPDGFTSSEIGSFIGSIVDYWKKVVLAAVNSQ
ncbi:MAG: hypothetical protein ACE5J2_01645 [Nitrososphaerales archaeon]